MRRDVVVNRYTDDCFNATMANCPDGHMQPACSHVCEALNELGLTSEMGGVHSRPVAGSQRYQAMAFGTQGVYMRPYGSSELLRSSHQRRSSLLSTWVSRGLVLGSQKPYDYYKVWCGTVVKPLRYWLGVNPVLFLNRALKFDGVPKPVLYAIWSTFKSEFSSKA